VLKNNIAILKEKIKYIIYQFKTLLKLNTFCYIFYLYKQ